jgi:hypothetical protein
MGRIAKRISHGAPVYKPLIFDYDFIRQQSEDRCFYCLSKQQAAALLAGALFLHWRTRWKSPTGETLDMDWIDAFASELEGELMADHCDIDTALTEITNSITTINENIVTINNNLVIVNNNVTNVENNLTIVNTNLEVVYVQNNSLTVNVTLQNFYTYTANALDVTSTAVFARYNAFCKAIARWVKDIVWRRMAQIDAAASETVDVLDELAALGGSVIGNIFGENPASYALSELHDAATNATDFDAFCCAMITTLAELTPSFLTFGGAIATFVPANFNQTVLASIVGSALLFEGAFDAFVSIMVEEYARALAENPTTFDCFVCNPNDPCANHLYDFSTGAKGQWLLERGTLYPGTGILGAIAPGDPSRALAAVRMDFATPCFTLIAKRMSCYMRFLPTTTGTPILVDFYYLLAGVLTRYSQLALVVTTSTFPTFTEMHLPGSGQIPAPPGGAGISRIHVHAAVNYYGGSNTAVTTFDIKSIEFLT